MSGKQIARLAIPLMVAVLAIGAVFQESRAQVASAPAAVAVQQSSPAAPSAEPQSAAPATEGAKTERALDYWSMLTIFMLSTFIGIGLIRRVSRLLHTPLMSITNAISAIAVVGSILVTGSDHPTNIRILGAVALFASVTNIVSGFMITDRMLKMFKKEEAR
jgi:NAD(P) transhydrogenase subunit alpha